MNKLLIIDPQNDFTDTTPPGSLSVPGALADYGRLVSFLQTNGSMFSEIHISLDTHTEKHIGHPKFWKQENDDDIPGSIYVLNFKDDKVIGINILANFGVAVDFPLIQVVPKEDNPELLQYVKEYINWFDSEENTHGQRPFIWFQHCIESTDGHKVHEILKNELDKYGDKVTYHIKGQNNLAEMYSIFKAERPVSDEDLSKLAKFVYTGVNTQEGTSARTYDDVSKMKNLNTKLNKDLLNQLLGEVGNQNTVYICGEARTHCVKSSIIDLLEYVEANGYDQSKIIFIKDISSPIGGTPNDIVYKVTGNHDTEDEAKSGYDYTPLYTTEYKTYKGKALASTEIVLTSGGRRHKRTKRGGKVRHQRLSRKRYGKRRSSRR